MKKLAERGMRNFGNYQSQHYVAGVAVGPFRPRNKFARRFVSLAAPRLRHPESAGSPSIAERPRKRRPSNLGSREARSVVQQVSNRDLVTVGRKVREHISNALVIPKLPITHQ
jgi:hypothetical protein